MHEHGVNCIGVQNVMVKKYLNRLSDLILSEMGSGHMTSRDLSVLCDISEREISSIKNKERSDIKLSIVVKICENTNISYADIFEISDREIFDRMIVGLILADGKSRYGISKIHS